MGLLLPFNNATSIAFDELLQITGLNEDSLVAQLALLCKAKVLVESSPDSKKYDLNMDFKSKKVKINLNIAIKSETKAEVDETHKTIEKDRELVIQVFFFLRCTNMLN
jgi:cullin 1